MLYVCTGPNNAEANWHVLQQACASVEPRLAPFCACCPLAANTSEQQTCTCSFLGSAIMQEISAAWNVPEIAGLRF